MPHRTDWYPHTVDSSNDVCVFLHDKITLSIVFALPVKERGLLAQASEQWSSQ
jgi:hypothetical protein